MRKLILALVTVAAFGLFAFSMAKKRQQVVPQTCPFDPNLSVGIAFQGPHRYFDTGEVQEKTMNARIAWFRPIEQPNPDAFSQRVYQEPPEEDWVWWRTLYPTTLIVQVTDAQNRLGSAEVWNFDLNLLDGLIEATPDGSSIIGTLTLEEPAEFRQVIIKDKENQTLAKLLIKNPKTVLRLIVEYGGWVPHPPKREVVVDEIRSPCDISIKGHPVQVYDEREKKVITAYYDCDKVRYQVKEGCPPHTGLNERHHIPALGFYLGPAPQGCSIWHIRGDNCETWVDVYGPGMPVKVPGILCMTKKFYNDNPKVDKVTPPEDYQKCYVRQKMTFPSRAEIDPGDQPVLDELRKLQESADETVITPAIEVPPYSEGCVHWDLSAVTDIRAVYAYPVEIIEKKGGDWFQRFVVDALKIVASGIFGAHHPKKNKLIDAFIDAWTKDVSQRQEVKEVLKVGDLKFYGDIWVLRLSLARAEIMGPPCPPVRNITQDVYVQIVVVRPDVTKVPTYGSLTVIRGQATTTPEPPKLPLEDRMSVETVPPEGVKIALGKGWKWKLTAKAAGREATIEISVPLKPPSVTIEVPAPQPMPPGDE